MTNSEMATYIAKRHDEDRPVDTSRKAAALEAMAWKDLQFAAEKQALIDKACSWLENIIFDKVDALFYDDNDIEFVKTVRGKDFADIFRKAMEGME